MSMVVGRAGWLFVENVFMEIRLVRQEDVEPLANYYTANAEHFRPWEPIREHGYYDRKILLYRLAEYENQHTSGAAAHFIGLADEAVIAHCSLTNIIYGPFRACFMGYGVAKTHEGSGVMTQVVRTVIDHAFNELALNRIMANYMPENKRSARLLKKLGFTWEGYAEKYLRINDQWEDHVLTSLINPATV